MTTTRPDITLARIVEVFVPTCARSGAPINVSVRSAELNRVKESMARWFGGFNVVRIDGGYEMTDTGELVEEPNDVVKSNTDTGRLEEYREDLLRLVQEMGERLDQESVACRIDHHMHIFLVKPRGATQMRAQDPQAELYRRRAIQAALCRMDSVDDARDLFCNLLHYDYEDDPLPVRHWPDSVKSCLAVKPFVFLEI